MKMKLLRTMLFISSAVSFLFAILTSNSKAYIYVGNATYGGDAYTGIQNAAAATARNITDLSEGITMGFVGLLVVIGLVLFSIALCIKVEKKEKIAPQNYEYHMNNSAPAPAPVNNGSYYNVPTNNAQVNNTPVNNAPVNNVPVNNEPVASEPITTPQTTGEYKQPVDNDDNNVQ